MDYQNCRRFLRQRLAEAPPTRIQLLAGPRQVGKTTLLLDLTREAGAAGLDPARFGTWLENACLSYAWNAGQRVAYWREEPLEVDGVLDGTWGRWAIEVTIGRVTLRDLRGLGEFTRRFPEYRPLVICEPSERGAAERLGIAAMSWQDFLWQGPVVKG